MKALFQIVYKLQRGALDMANVFPNLLTTILYELIFFSTTSSSTTFLVGDCKKTLKPTIYHTWSKHTTMLVTD